MTHLVVLRCRNCGVSRLGNGDVAWPWTLLKKFRRFRSARLRAAEARVNASKKRSRAGKEMAADTWGWGSVAAGWRGRKIGRGSSKRRICMDCGGGKTGGGYQGLRCRR